jgi:hypothetical protein
MDEHHTLPLLTRDYSLSLIELNNKILNKFNTMTRNDEQTGTIILKK